MQFWLVIEHAARNSQKRSKCLGRHLVFKNKEPKWHAVPFWLTKLRSPPTHKEASEDGMNRHITQIKCKDILWKTLTIWSMSAIYTVLAGKCIYNETSHGLQLAPLMLGALFQPFPLSRISLFPSTHKVSLFQPSLTVIFQYFIKV